MCVLSCVRPVGVCFLFGRREGGRGEGRRRRGKNNPIGFLLLLCFYLLLLLLLLLLLRTMNTNHRAPAAQPAKIKRCCNSFVYTMSVFLSCCRAFLSNVEYFFVVCITYELIKCLIIRSFPSFRSSSFAVARSFLSLFRATLHGRSIILFFRRRRREEGTK